MIGDDEIGGVQTHSSYKHTKVIAIYRPTMRITLRLERFFTTKDVKKKPHKVDGRGEQ